MSLISIKSMLFLVRLVTIFSVIFSFYSQTLYAANNDERLLRVSIELFPAVLASNLNIFKKQHRNGTLVLVLLYDNDEVRAKALAKQLSKVEVIKTLPIQVEVVNIHTLTTDFSPTPAGIFLTQQLEAQDLASVINYGINHQVLVFSPFESDVARGVPVGIAIRDRILPYVNTLALRKAQLQLKPFFLRISKHYGK